MVTHIYFIHIYIQNLVIWEVGSTNTKICVQSSIQISAFTQRNLLFITKKTRMASNKLKYKIPNQLPAIAALIKTLPTSINPQENKQLGITEEDKNTPCVHPNSTLICPICFNVPLKPVMIDLKSHYSHCFHLFCYQCLQASFYRADPPRAGYRTTQLCPICQQFFTKINVVFHQGFHPTIRREYYSIRVNCPQLCGLVINISNLERHLTEYCQNRIIKCPGLKCQIKGTEENLQKYHIAKCQYFRFRCPDCGIIIKNQEEADKHICHLSVMAQFTHLAQRFQNREEGLTKEDVPFDIAIQLNLADVENELFSIEKYKDFVKTKSMNFQEIPDLEQQPIPPLPPPPPLP